MAESALAEIDTTRPFDAAEYYRAMRQHGYDPYGTYRDGKYWEAASTDVGAGCREFFTAWGLRGDPDRYLRRVHIAEVWSTRPHDATFVQLGV
jgi:hypothetical protein